MFIYIAVLSISLLLLALVVSESLATPLTVAGLIGLAVLRLSAASSGWARRGAFARAPAPGRHRRRDTAGQHEEAESFAPPRAPF